MNTAIIIVTIICGSLVALAGIVGLTLCGLYKAYIKNKKKENDNA